MDKRSRKFILAYLVVATLILSAAIFGIYTVVQSLEVAAADDERLTTGRGEAMLTAYAIVGIVAIALIAINALSKYIGSKLNLPKPWEE